MRRRSVKVAVVYRARVWVRPESNGIEHGKADRDLVDVEAHDPEANDKLVKALQDLKDLKYPMVDQLERLKDAPIELIMASLHLEGDTRGRCPSSGKSDLRLELPPN
ncbi:hypothetical protein Tco_0927301 [Tanacetum coccineum]